MKQLKSLIHVLFFWTSNLANSFSLDYRRTSISQDSENEWDRRALQLTALIGPLCQDKIDGIEVSILKWIRTVSDADIFFYNSTITEVRYGKQCSRADTNQHKFHESLLTKIVFQISVECHRLCQDIPNINNDKYSKGSKGRKEGDGPGDGYNKIGYHASKEGKKSKGWDVDGYGGYYGNFYSKGSKGRKGGDGGHGIGNHIHCNNALNDIFSKERKGIISRSPSSLNYKLNHPVYSHDDPTNKSFKSSKGKAHSSSYSKNPHKPLNSNDSYTSKSAKKQHSLEDDIDNNY